MSRGRPRRSIYATMMSAYTPESAGGKPAIAMNQDAFGYHATKALVETNLYNYIFDQENYPIEQDAVEQSSSGREVEDRVFMRPAAVDPSGALIYSSHTGLAVDEGNSRTRYGYSRVIRSTRMTMHRFYRIHRFWYWLRTRLLHRLI